MDNISPLRQWGVQSTSELHLFKPNDVLRGLDRVARLRLLAEAAGTEGHGRIPRRARAR